MSCSIHLLTDLKAVKELSDTQEMLDNLYLFSFSMPLWQITLQFPARMVLK